MSLLKLINWNKNAANVINVLSGFIVLGLIGWGIIGVIALVLWSTTIKNPLLFMGIAVGFILLVGIVKIIYELVLFFRTKRK